MSRMKGGEKGMFDRRSVFMHGFEPIDDIKDILNLKKSGFLTEPLSKIYNEAVRRCKDDTHPSIEHRLFTTRYSHRFSIEAFCVVLTIYVSIPKEMFEDIYFDDLREPNGSATQKELSKKIEFFPQYSSTKTVVFKQSRLASFLKLVYERNNSKEVESKDDAFVIFLNLFSRRSLNGFQIPGSYVAGKFFGKQTVRFKLPYLLLLLGIAIDIDHDTLKEYFGEERISKLLPTPVNLFPITSANEKGTTGLTGNLSEDGEEEFYGRVSEI